LWDLVDDEYLVGPPEDQAYAFFAPIRQYLFDTIPSFEEDFEEYQSYWDEMQVDYSETKSVAISQSVREGALQLHAIEGEDHGNFGLFFPQISGKAFALQFDFNFMDPMESGDILTAAVQTDWMNSESQEGYSPYCDFYPRDEQLACGLYQVGGSAGLNEIASGEEPYLGIYSPHTLLVIFYDGQYVSFIDGFITAYVDGLEFFNQQISINVGTNEDRQKFDAAVDDIKFWNLDGVVYQPDEETSELQLVNYPILEYLVSTEPTFHEDFESPQAYWEMPVYDDDQQQTSLAQVVSDGVVRLDSREEEMIHNYWDLTFPQFQESANFALKYDINNLVEFARINMFISSASSGTYLFGMGISDGGGLEYQLNKESSGGDNEGVPESIISNGIPYDSQTVTLLMVSYQSKFAIFVEDLFLGYADGVEIADNPEIVIFVPVDEEPTIVELDNIEYWNLDGVDVSRYEKTTTEETDVDYEYLLAYIETELAPTFEDDFSQPDMVWGGTSEGPAIWALVEDGELVITDHTQDVGWTPDHAVPGLTFPTNGLFAAQNFLMEFDFTFPSEHPEDEIGIRFRSTRDFASGYQIVGTPGGGWSFSEDGEEINYGLLSSRSLNHIRLLVVDQYAYVLFNGQLAFTTDQIDEIGTINRIWVKGNRGGDAVFDNVKFWNLDGGEIDITEFIPNN
jgi:hypothetical protein